MVKVTIGITTYNLARYIKQALDSVLMQKVDFDYGILVVDDASDDGTVGILKEYQQKYPDRIKLLLCNENGGSLSASNKLFGQIRSEYFSFLDGDDFWLDENRLQKQVDFLDKNPDYVMCGGRTIVLKNGKTKKKAVCASQTYNFDDFLAGRCPFVHTSSILLRNVVYNNGVPPEYSRAEKTIYNCAYRGEDIRFIHHLEKGKLFVFPEDFSVYRIHEKGVWQGASALKQKLEAVISNLKYMELFGNYESQLFKDRFFSSYKSLWRYLSIEDARGYDLSDKEHLLLVGLLGELYAKRDVLGVRTYVQDNSKATTDSLGWVKNVKSICRGFWKTKKTKLWR